MILTRLRVREIRATYQLEAVFFTETGHLPSDKLHSEIIFPIYSKVKVQTHAATSREQITKT